MLLAICRLLASQQTPPLRRIATAAFSSQTLSSEQSSLETGSYSSLLWTFAAWRTLAKIAHHHESVPSVSPDARTRLSFPRQVLCTLRTTSSVVRRLRRLPRARGQHPSNTRQRTPTYRTHELVHLPSCRLLSVFGGAKQADCPELQ